MPYRGDIPATTDDGGAAAAVAARSDLVASSAVLTALAIIAREMLPARFWMDAVRNPTIIHQLAMWTVPALVLATAASAVALATRSRDLRPRALAFAGAALLAAGIAVTAWQLRSSEYSATSAVLAGTLPALGHAVLGAGIGLVEAGRPARFGVPARLVWGLGIGIAVHDAAYVWWPRRIGQSIDAHALVAAMMGTTANASMPLLLAIAAHATARRLRRSGALVAVTEKAAHASGAADADADVEVDEGRTTFALAPAIGSTITATAVLFAAYAAAYAAVVYKGGANLFEIRGETLFVVLAAAYPALLTTLAFDRVRAFSMRLLVVALVAHVLLVPVMVVRTPSIYRVFSLEVDDAVVALWFFVVVAAQAVLWVVLGRVVQRAMTDSVALPDAVSPGVVVVLERLRSSARVILVGTAFVALAVGYGQHAMYFRAADTAAGVGVAAAVVCVVGSVTAIGALRRMRDVIEALPP